MTIFYKLGDKLYANITNACPCDCVFCIRNGPAGIGDAKSLWLAREPDVSEIKAAFDGRDLDGLTEVVFCGYGEPMERAGDVIEVSRYIKSRCALPVRVNTNGLVKLIDPGFDMQTLRGVDAVSVSLNADDEEEYLRVTRPRFGAGSYGAMLAFAREAMLYTKVSLSIVGVLDAARVQRCREIADVMGVPFRVR